VESVEFINDQVDSIGMLQKVPDKSSKATPISWSPDDGESMRTTRLIASTKVAPGKPSLSSAGVMVKSRTWPGSRGGVSLDTK
jgi:hypothetical protein